MTGCRFFVVFEIDGIDHSLAHSPSRDAVVFRSVEHGRVFTVPIGEGAAAIPSPEQVKALMRSRRIRIRCGYPASTIARSPARGERLQ